MQNQPNTKEHILQICSYYTGSSLYQDFFRALESFAIKEDIYVFTHFKNELLHDKESKPNVYISRCYNRLDRLIFHLKHYKVKNDIEEKLNISNYNLFHAHSLFSNGYIAYKLHKKYQIPYIVAVRNTDINLFFARMPHLRLLGIKILNNAERIIFISPPYKKQTIEKYIPSSQKKVISEKSIVIPNGINKYWLENKYLRQSNLANKKIRLIYVGSIDRNKNIETTIKACNLLNEQGYEVSFKIVGKILDSKYRDLIHSNSYLKHIPYCQKEELLNYYRDSDIFVMPSIHETFGLVYAEAMSQGLPVVYTSGQGFDEQFEEGEVGFHVEATDYGDIAEKIRTIMYNYLEISQRCTSNSEKFNWSSISKKYMDLYQNIIMEHER